MNISEMVLCSWCLLHVSRCEHFKIASVLFNYVFLVTLQKPEALLYNLGHVFLLAFLTLISVNQDCRLDALNSLGAGVIPCFVMFLSLLVNVVQGKYIFHSLAPCCLAGIDAVFIANQIASRVDLTELELHPNQSSLQEEQRR